VIIGWQMEASPVSDLLEEESVDIAVNGRGEKRYAGYMIIYVAKIGTL
jgi:hypothetical protein